MISVASDSIVNIYTISRLYLYVRLGVPFWYGVEYIYRIYILHLGFDQRIYKAYGFIYSLVLMSDDDGGDNGGLALQWWSVESVVLDIHI